MTRNWTDEFSAALEAHRERLLQIVDPVDECALTLPTRNDGWTVRDVAAHLLATDAQLVSLLEQASGGGGRVPGLTRELDESETARWKDATPAALRAGLDAGRERWERALDALAGADPAAIQVSVWWVEGLTSLTHVLGDWCTHDAQHAEDIRLAIEDER